MTAHVEEWLQKATQKDQIYQKLLEKLLSLEPAYRRIINALPDQDRMILEEYIMLSEELESRCTYLLIDKISF